MEINVAEFKKKNIPFYFTNSKKKFVSGEGLLDFYLGF